MPDAAADEEVERVSVASSFTTSKESRPRRTPGTPFSIRDAPFNEGVVTAVEHQASTLQPPEATQGRRSSSAASTERTVSFTPDLPTKVAKGRASYKTESQEQCSKARRSVTSYSFIQKG